jgi:hypothetical protein
MVSERREVPCPDCHRECGWCSWYAKNARAVGCGSMTPSGRKTRKPCEMARSLEGTTCPLCGGTEKVRAITTYERIGDSNGQ